MMNATACNNAVSCAEQDVLSEQAIRDCLRTEILGHGLEVRTLVPSTNLCFKERDTSLLPEGFAIIAEGQTHGRGRMGRAFFSPPGAGIYLSVLLRPPVPATDFPFLTVCAAVAVHEMLRETYGVATGIKWVNDIYHGGLKLCGILTEALTGARGGSPEEAVVGIGINTGRVPDEVDGLATSLERITGRRFSRSRLAAETLNHFERVYLEFVRDGGKQEIRKRYAEALFILGRLVEVHGEGGSFEALARDVDANGALVVETPDGRLQTLLSEEVRIKLA